MRKIAKVSLGVLILFCGCDDRNPIEKYRLPPTATNVKELGNDWHTFDVEIGGRKHQFLHVYDGTGHTLAEIHAR